MQRNIRISFLVLFFIPSYAGLNINGITLKVFRLLNKFKVSLNSELSRISSGLFNSNHSQYIKDTAYQNYRKVIDPKAVLLYFGQLLINH
jgi:hypothetical protein